MATDVFDQRRKRLASFAAVDAVEARLVTDLVDCTYLSGFDSSNASMVVGESSVLVTDGRYLQAATEQCPGLQVVENRDATAGAVRAAAAAGVQRLGFEPGDVSLTQWRRLSALALDLGVELVETVDRISELRMVKDPAEVAAIKHACQISQRALVRLLAEVEPGVTELAIAARLHWLMCDEGAQKPAFDSIVASGPNSAQPHHAPNDRPIEAGDLLKIDFGALYNGYHADMTRTFVIGQSHAWQVEIHEIVDLAAAAGRAALVPGVEFAAVDRAARQVVEDAGFGQYFGHGLGHGVGLQIHEAPMFSATSTGTLAENMTVTIEPGIYLPGRGGVRIEDCLVVTAQGAESLTTMNRGLVALT